jgi:topoisomerase-4 subunit A
MKVVKVGEKTYIGKDIIHAAVFQKNDERTTYNMIYMDGDSGKSFAKRFNVTGVTRDKEYFLAKENEKSKVHYLSVNPNAEAEVVRIILTPGSKAHKKNSNTILQSLRSPDAAVRVLRYKIPDQI